MFFSSPQRLDELIVIYLSQHQQAKTKQMLAEIHFQKKPTMQGFYKQLRELQNKGVLIKRSTRYFLNQNWAMSMASFGQQLFLSVTKNDDILEAIIKTGKQSFNFYDLANLDYFWTHIYFQMVERCTKPLDVWSFNPQAWYYILHPLEEEQFMNNLQHHHITLHLALGAINTMNVAAKKWLEGLGAKVCFAADLFPKKKMVNYYNVIGDFLIEIHINPVVAERTRRLFEEGKAATPEQTLGIAFLKARHTIHFYYRPRKLTQVKKQLMNCFV